MNKNLLTNLTKKELLTVGKKVGLTGVSKFTKEEILEEVCITIAGLEIAENKDLTDDQIIALTENNNLDEVLDMNFTTNTEKTLIKEVEGANINNYEVKQEDYDTAPHKSQYEVSNDYNTGSLDIEFFNQPGVKQAIYAELKVVNKKYSAEKIYDVQPFAKLVEAMTALDLADRSVDFALATLHYDIKSLFDTKSITQDDILRIIECYNEEENAKIQLYINQSMANKQPSDKQLEFMNNQFELIQDIESMKDLVLSGIALKRNFTKTALDVKLWCDQVNSRIAELPATEGQIKFLKSMIQVGMKLNIKDITYGNASKLIKENVDTFYRKSLVKAMSNCGIHIEEYSIQAMDIDRVKKYNFALTRIGFAFKLASQFTGENIWRLLDKMIPMSAVQIQALQNACLTKDMAYVNNLI